ncbi:MAG TPA: hypothetical protein VGS58_11110 [Candidatus Sulfopaludibacter sp.]|nr:hypothetical protein [Candidatus Sulfopaludibacter sp.]
MEARVVQRNGLWLVLAAVLLIRLPLLNQAIQGDDHVYISEGAHALIEPLHPGQTKYVFQGREVDLRGHTHPATVGWFLAPLIVACHGVQEVPFHAAYIVFSLIAVAAMWSLARRFSPQPLWAALLFVAVPAFVVNGNSLEADVPFLAFWMAAIALFCADRLLLAAAAMVLASMTAYQAVLLTPILAVWVWLKRRDSRAAWAVIFVPPVTIAAWQIFERLATGAMPAAVLSGYFTIYQTLIAKLKNAAMLTIHSWFIVFPLLLPPALAQAWRKRREPHTLFLLAWIGIFFAGALAILFAGSARYLLPMAAPVCLLASSLRPRWLALGFGLQLLLSVALAAVNYQHWDAYRQFAYRLRPLAAGHRVWIDDEWGLRHYVGEQGGLPLVKTTRLRPGDIVVSSELGHSSEITAPVTPLAKLEIHSAIPLRLIGLEGGSGYSDVSRGMWPIGISTGVIDRVRAVQIGERHPTLEYVKLDSPQAAAHIVSGIYTNDRWMSKSAVVVVKSPETAKPLSVNFYISDLAKARKITLLLDDRVVASQTYSKPGEAYTLTSSPVKPAGPSAMVGIEVDRTFNAPGDNRDLGVVLIGVGFK